jgi:protein SCO1/2
MNEKKNGLALTLVSTIAIIVLVVGLFVYTMTQPRIMNVKELVNNGAITFEEPVPILPFNLLDQQANAFSQEQFQDQWTLLFFGFSHCGGFCPTTLAMLDQLVDQLEADVAEQTQVVMVSVDPERDTPERLAEYMGNFDPAFIGVTGDYPSIRLLSEQFYIAIQQADKVNEGEHYDVAHGEQIVLINPDGKYHGFFKPPFSLGRLKTTYQSIVISYRRQHN